MPHLLIALVFFMAAAFPAAAMTPPSLAASIAPRSPMMGLARRSEEGLGVSLMGWQSSRDKRQTGTTKADNPNNEKTDTWRATLLLDYSPAPRWTGVLSVPYQSTHASFSGTEQKADGLGDAALFGKYAIFQDRRAFIRREIFAVFGFDLATGATDLKDAQGVRLPATFQPGSNSSDLFAGFAAAWSLESVSLYGDAMYKLNSSRAYTFGDSLGLNAGIHYPLPKAPAFGLTAELNAQFYGKDTSDLPGPGVYPDKKVKDSGGETVFLSPGVQYSLGLHSSFSAALQLPVYQNFRGTQLASGTDFVFSLSRRF